MDRETVSKDAPPTYDEAVGSDTVVQRTATEAFPSNQIGYAFGLHSIEPQTAQSSSNTIEDMETIRLALTTKNRALLIKILCRRSSEQRLEIADLYNATHSETLPRDIKRFVGKGQFGILTSALAMPLPAYLARAVHKSGRSFSWLGFIMFVLSNQERHDTSYYFEKKYGLDLSKFIMHMISLTRDHRDKFIIAQILRIFENDREESSIVHEKEVLRDAEKFKDISKNKESKEEIQYILFTKSFAHIKAVCKEYGRQSCGTSIDSLFDEAYSHNKFVLLNIINYSLNPVEYFACTLNEYSNGFSVKQKIFNSVFIMRSEVDLMDIKAEFRCMHQVCLKDRIRNKTSGYYKYALYELLGEKRSEKVKKIIV